MVGRRWKEVGEGAEGEGEQVIHLFEMDQLLRCQSLLLPAPLFLIVVFSHPLLLFLCFCFYQA